MGASSEVRPLKLLVDFAPDPKTVIGIKTVLQAHGRATAGENLDLALRAD